MHIESPLDNVIGDEQPVVFRHLVKTTKELSKSYLLSEFNDVPCSDICFVSGCFPDDFKLPIRGKKISYVGLKQNVQYGWISHKLESLADWSAHISRCVVIFEQTYLGNIHYHMVLSSKLHKHDIRAIISEIFGFVRSQDIILNVHVQGLTSLSSLVKYLYDKKGTKKAYEELDMDYYKPMYLK